MLPRECFSCQQISAFWEAAGKGGGALNFSHHRVDGTVSIFQKFDVPAAHKSWDEYQNKESLGAAGYFHQDFAWSGEGGKVAQQSNVEAEGDVAEVEAEGKAHRKGLLRTRLEVYPG